MVSRESDRNTQEWVHCRNQKRTFRPTVQWWRGRAKATDTCPLRSCSPWPSLAFPVYFQIDFLDTIAEGVQVTRQGLGSGQYRWTVTFLDEGDDFELEDVVTRNYLNTSAGTEPEVTSTKVMCCGICVSRVQRCVCIFPEKPQVITNC